MGANPVIKLPPGFNLDPPQMMLPPGFKLDGPAIEQTSDPTIMTGPQPPGFMESAWSELKRGPLNPANLAGMFAPLKPVGFGPGGGDIGFDAPAALEQMTGQTSDLAAKAGQRLREGDYTGAAATGINYLLTPLGVGQSSEEMGDKLAMGNYGGAAGQGLGLATNLITMAKAPEIARIPSRIRGAFETDPTRAYLRAYRPAESGVQLDMPEPTWWNEAHGSASSVSAATDRLPNTLANVKAASPTPITTNEQVIPAARAAIQQRKQAMNQWMARARGRSTSGMPVAVATADAVSSATWLENPALARQIVADAERSYGGRSFTVQQLQQLLKEKNAELKSFYDRSQGRQIAAQVSGTPEAVVKAQRDAIADTLYKTLDPEGNGMGPRMVQRQMGDIIDVLEQAQHSRNTILAQKPLSTAGATGRVAAELVGEPWRFITGRGAYSMDRIRGAVTGMSDSLIARAFANVGRPPEFSIPLPGQMLYPVGDLQRLLTAGDMVTPLPADTSFVRGTPPTPGQWATAQRPALPPGSAPFTQGTIVPDIKGRPDMRSGYNAGLLPPPAPGVPPINVQPRGPGSVNVPPYPRVPQTGLPMPPTDADLLRMMLNALLGK